MPTPPPPTDHRPQLLQARMHLLLQYQGMAMAAAAVFAVVMAWLVHAMVPLSLLLGWLAVKQAVLIPRVLQPWWYLRRVSLGLPVNEHQAQRWMLAFTLVDGAAWGALGWALTPVHRLDLAAVSISSLMGLAAIGGFMLATDIRALIAFVVPMLLPNALHFLSRGDPLGLFGATSIASYTLIMVLVARSTHRRITELLTLRFESERLAQDRAQALAQATQHSQAKSRFLATVSHEMRTPLHGILGLTRVLQQEVTAAAHKERLGLIERSGEHLLLVINDILDFSKIEAGRLSMEERPFDLLQVLEESVSVFEVLAQRKGVPLTLRFEWAGPCEVMGDPGRVRQVLHNLLGNAVKFTERGRIELQARPLAGDDLFEIVVRDTGPGISAPDLLTIFDAFNQASSPADRRRGGTGLGLSIARQLCHAMQGTLHCDSAPGVGSVFRATLRLPPACMPRAEPERLRPDVHGAPVHAQVLLVEDNPVNVLVAEAMLSNLGCEVMTLGDGAQALDWLAHQRCDLVLMDCAMPVMDGFEATRRIRARELREGRARTPVVALTANLLPFDRAQCLACGMDDFLAKPFDLDDLRTVLNRALVRASSLRVA